MKKQQLKPDNDHTVIKENDNTVKKRGRPKGSKNKAARSDRLDITKPDKDNSVFIHYSLELSSLPKIDMNSPLQVKRRIQEYFDISNKYDMRSSVASFALSFHVDRVTLFNWLNRKTGTIKNDESFNSIKTAYNIICNQYEYMMNTGKINPVSGIFLLKNNFGYKDQTEYIVSPGNDKQETIQDITDKAGLLTDD